MRQNRLLSLTLLNLENDILRNWNFNQIIDNFSHDRSKQLQFVLGNDKNKKFFSFIFFSKKKFLKNRPILSIFLKTNKKFAKFIFFIAIV